MPTPMLWYLFALILWRLLNYGLRKIGLNVSWWIVILFIVLSVFVGFIPSIGHKFALSRIVCFAPYFFLGVILQKYPVLNIIKEKLNFWVSGFVLIAALIVSAIFAYYHICLREVYYGSTPYPIENQIGYMFARIATYPLAVILSLAFIRLFSFESNLFGRIGKDSLKYYMFHGIVILMFVAFGAPWSFSLAVLYAMVTTSVIFMLNQTTLSDFAIAPISFVMKLYKQKRANK